ncbi:hypothetical protein [Dokdonia sp. Asnod2-E02]|uniref:hypothetical protein n=1 Tax=Dokdonia sp. Asnod2-E02 TaxID=3160574 RepID=UPI00386C7FF5
MFFVVNKYLLRRRFVGVTLWPFIVMRTSDLKKDEVFINHEKIHIRQQAEMLVIPFFIWYAIEYLYRLIQYRDNYVAYLNISFEREAYARECEINYLRERPFWSFIAYL